MALHCSKVLKFLKEEKVESETVSGTATKSDVWKHFTFLNFSKDHTTAAGQYTGFVLCSFCKSALKHNRTTSGTTHLRDHVTHCLKILVGLINLTIQAHPNLLLHFLKPQ